MKVAIVAATLVFGVGSLLAGASRSVDGSAYVINVPEGETESVSATDVSALGDGTGAIRELRKTGAGTLVAASIPTFLGTVTVAAGVYQISAADHCGTSDGPTVVESGATLAVNNWLTFEAEEFVLSGSGVSDSMGVIHLLDWQQINLARVTMNGDCRITGTDSCHYFSLIASDTYAIDMNGHTMTFETGNAVFLSCPTIVDAGHFVCLANNLFVADGTVLDHGKEHTITIAQGRSHTNASLLFWDNRLLGSNDWTIVHNNPTSPDGIYCNLDGGRWYGDVIYGENVVNKSLFGGAAVTMYGKIKGSGALNVGRGIICGDTSEFAGYIGCNEGGVAGGMQAIDPSDALGYCNWIWLMRTDSTGGYGYTASDFRDEILANYGPYNVRVMVNEGDLFDYSGSISGIRSTAYSKFYNFGKGVFQFSGEVTRSELMWFQPCVGPVRLSGAYAGELVANGIDDYPMPGGRIEFANFAAASGDWKAFHLCSPSDASQVMEVAYTNVSLDARITGTAFALGTVSAEYGKTCMEILDGCAITNALKLGDSWNGVNDNQSACGFYMRGGYLCVPLNPGVGDTTIGKYTQGYFEQSGGDVIFECYTQVGRHADAVGQFYQTGGNFLIRETRYHLGAEGRAVHFQSGGSFVSNADLHICDSSYNTLGGGTVADMTVSGAGTECVVSRRIVLARRFDCVATLNINDGGRLTTGEIIMARYGRDSDSSPLWYTNDFGYVNFNGGVLRTQQNQWNIFGTENGAYNGQRGEYTNNWPTAVTIFDKGATIEVPENMEAFVSTPMRAPVGNGVVSVPLPASFDRSTYVAPPTVTISGDGTNATALATIDSRTKTLTGVVVTSPGWGYTWAKATVAGGGKADTCEIDCTLGDVSGGGLSKAGAGLLILSTANTYTGATRVDAGTLRIASGGRIAAESPVVIADGATLEVLNGQSFASVSGSGTLYGDIAEPSFVADASAAKGLTVNGALTVGANPVVALKNLPDMSDESFVRIRIPVVSATSYSGLENLSDATFTGATLPAGVEAEFRQGGSGLYVRVGRKVGMKIMMR